MIKIIDRYLMRTFLLPLVYCVLAFIIIFLAYDLLNNLGSFIDLEIPSGDIFRYYLYQIPILFSIIMPVNTLLALLYCLGNLSRTNEIIAMRSSGIALFRIIRSYLIMGFIMFLLTFILGEIFVPRARRLSAEIMPKTSNMESLFSSSEMQARIFYNAKDDRQWVVGEVSNTFKNVTITQYTHSREQRKRTTIEAREAEYIPGYGWWLYDVTEIWYYSDGTPQKAKTYKKLHKSAYVETPGDIVSAQHSRVSMMNYIDIIRTIRHTEPDTDYSRELRMALQTRLANPFACFVFVLLAAPFGIFHTRAGMMKGALTSIGLCLFYFLVVAYLINLGQAGYIIPFIAAWSANIAFLIIGGYLLHRMR